MRTRTASIAAASFLTASGLLGAISGSVITREGQPIHKCEVTAHRLESSAERSARIVGQAAGRRAPVATAVTDEKGSFRLDTDEPVVDIAASADGYEPAIVRSEDGDDQVIALRKAAPKRGAVTAAGKPVEGAVVIWAGNSGEFVTRTDSAGSYSVADPAVWADRFTVVHPQFAIRDSRRERVTFQRDAPMKLTLEEGVTIRGRVVSARGEGVGGATLHVDGLPAGSTVEDGTFRIVHAPEKWRWIEAFSNESAGGMSNSAAATYEVPLSAVTSTRTRVVDKVTEKPVIAAEVLMFNERSGLQSFVTDRNGYFSVAQRLLQTNVRVVHPRYAGFPFVEDMLVRAAPVAVLSGTVVDEQNAPVAGARVAAFPGKGQLADLRDPVSAPDGRFTAHLLYPGEVQIEAKKRGFVGTPAKLSVEPAQLQRNIRLRLAKGIDVAIRVRVADGRPLADARIEIAREVDDEQRREYYGCADSAACTTDASGAALVTLRPGNHFISVFHEGFARLEVPDIAIGAGQKPIEVVLGSGAEISGVARWDDGTPAPNISISAAGGSVPTNADGTFVIRGLKSGTTRLSAQHPIASIRVPPMQITAPARGVIVTIPRAAEIHGRVVDRETGQPIKTFRSAVGTVKFGDGTAMVSSNGPAWMSFSSADGSFLLTAVPTGAVEVLASAEGYLTGRKEDVTVEAGKTVTGVEIALERGVRLTGRVVSEDGSGVADAKVTLTPKSWRRFAGQAASATTGEAGAFAVDALEPGEHTASVSKKGFVWTQQTLVLKESENHAEFRLATAHTLTVRVVDSAGQPVSSANVTARTRGGQYVGMSGRTEASGEAKIEGLPEDAVDVVASKVGLVQGTAAGVDPKQAGVIAITLRTGGVISGRVVGLSAAERRAARVFGRVGELATAADILSDGQFRMRAVPAGLVTVYAQAGSRRSQSRAVDVRDGGEARVELTFNQNLVVRGRVVSSGKPVGGAQLTFSPTTSGGASAFATTQFQTGEYEVRLEVPGEYRVRVSRPAGSITETYVFTADTTRDFELKEGSIRGVVLDAATGQPVSEAVVTAEEKAGRSGASPLARSDSGGRFAATASPGRYVLVARKGGYAHRVADVDVAEGAESVVEFRLERSEGLSVRTIDPQTGAPVYAQIFLFDEQGRTVYGDRPLDREQPLRIPVAAGTYALYARPESDLYVEKRVRVSAPAAVEVSLERAAVLVIVLRQGGSYRLSVLTPEAHAKALSTRGARIEPGTTRFGRLAPGAKIVDLLDERGEVVATRTLTLRAGEETRIELP